MIHLLTTLAFACGAPIQQDPGSKGTAIYESNDQIATFTTRHNRITWERITAGDANRRYVMTISGPLQANIETDVKTDTAISAQNDRIVELDDGRVTPISEDPFAATTIFGATVDGDLMWQVLAYHERSQTLALFSETLRGSFTTTATAKATCSASMLTLVRETTGRYVGVCGDVAVVYADGKLKTASLPVAAALRLDDRGTAVFTGVQNGEISRLRVATDLSVTVEASVALPEPAMYALPVDDQTMIAVGANSARFAIRAHGAWTAGPHLTFAEEQPFLSARGAPLRVLTGSYDLQLATMKDGTFQQQSLGIIGTEPTDAPRRGCASTSSPFAWLSSVAIACALLLRRARRDRCT